MSFSTDSSRMYAALRCIETELDKPRPSIKRIREIVAEAGRELRPTPRAADGLDWCDKCNSWQYFDGQNNCKVCGTARH